MKSVVTALAGHPLVEAWSAGWDAAMKSRAATIPATDVRDAALEEAALECEARIAQFNDPHLSDAATLRTVARYIRSLRAALNPTGASE